jgi:nicotinamidase-related amidase
MKHFLVVVDMQTDFIDGSLGTPEAVAIKPAVLNKIHTFPGEIFATVDTHGENYLQTAEGRHLPVEHCIKGTPGWAVDREIATALNGRGAVFVEKPTFGSLILPQLLEDAAAGEDFDVTLEGLCTDICVVSNALLLKAYMPEVPMCVDSACCAGVTPEKHASALEVLGSCQVSLR